MSRFILGPYIGDMPKMTQNITLDLHKLFLDLTYRIVDLSWSSRKEQYCVESLQSHMILTMSHWSSGLTCLLPATRDTGSNPLGGTYVKPGFSC
jgi:hypothetical protein